MADYYELLGIPRDATNEQIKKAYRQLALLYHPDRNAGSKEAEEKFKEVTAAYEVLRDPEKRARYDRYGEAAFAGGGADFQHFDFADALSIFMRDFGGLMGLDVSFGMRTVRGRERSRKRRGEDVRLRLPITLAEVASGTTKRLQVATLVGCEACGATGSKDGASPVPCSTCGGTGEVRRVQRSMLGQLVSVMPCRTCGGEGSMIAQPCPVCLGEGRKRDEREVEIEIPPGVTSENYLTMRGNGNAGFAGGPPGDLIVLIDVEEDERFVRDGRDIISEVRITFSQAALGTEVEVPTVEGGKADLTVPAGTQHGQMLRIRGRGLASLEGRGRGDHLVRVSVWTPQDLSPEEEKLFRRLGEIERPAPEVTSRDSDPGFWAKVKEALGGG